MEQLNDEVIVYTVAIGNLPGLFAPRKQRKMARIAMNFIKKLDGFIGVHLAEPHGTLCLFETDKQAKAAKSDMEAYGIVTGRNICEVYVQRKYIQMAKELREKQKGEARK